MSRTFEPFYLITNEAGDVKIGADQSLKTKDNAMKALKELGEPGIYHLRKVIGRFEIKKLTRIQSTELSNE